MLYTALFMLALVWMPCAPTDPTAQPDQYTTVWSASLEVEAPGVLGNDSDIEGDPLEAHLLSPPEVGQLSLRRDGRFTYTPNYGQIGTVTFTYKAWDGTGFTSAQVSIEVTEGNHAPEPQEDHFTLESGTRLEIAAPGVLVNDTDIEGKALTTHLYEDVEHGHLGFHQDGSFWYDPQGFVGTTHFTYGAYDGQYKGYATVTLTVRDPAPQHAPIITSTPPTDGAPHQAYFYQIEAFDEDGDVLTYSISGPPGMSHTGHRLSWVPEESGSHEVNVTVTDGTHQTEQSFSIEVSEYAPVNRPPRITSEPVTHLLLRPIAQQPQPMELQDWWQWDYGESGITASWEVSDTGTDVYQRYNARPSLWVSDQFHRDVYITGTVEVATVSDNDYIGFGIVQGPGRMQLFRWKQGSQDTAQRGMSVVHYNLPGEQRPDFWATEASNGQLLYHNATGWQEKRPYDFALELHPGELAITISQNGTLIEHITLQYEVIGGGYFALYNYSQEKVWYRAMTHQPLASRTYRYDTQAEDPDGDALNWSVSGPPGLTIEEATGALSWDATTEHVGTHPVSITVTDPFGASDTQTYNLHVANRKPVIVSQPITRARVDNPYLYDSAAHSPLGDTLSFALTQQPPGMEIEPQRGLISWQPTESQLGTHPVTLTATDTQGNQTTQTYHITVSPAENQPPRILSELPTYLPYGKAWSKTLIVEDEGPVTFELTEGPSTMAINRTSGLMAWRPDRLGEVPITVTVRDEDGLQTSGNVTLRVVNNSPPRNTTSPPLVARVDEPYQVALTATDADGDPLTWQLLYGPAGLTLSGTSLSWTPTAGQQGAQRIAVTVWDGYTRETASWTVHVIGNNTPPELSGSPAPEARVGEPYEARFYAYDAEDDRLSYSAQGIAGLTIDPGGILRLNPAEPGYYDITVTVQDSHGAKGELTYPLVVAHPDGTEPNSAPTITSQPPTEMDLGNSYSYQPEVSDAQGDPITLELIRAPTGCQLIDGIISYNPTKAGTETIALRASDPAGAYSEQRFELHVAANTNTPPRITTDPSTQAEAGRTYHYDAEVIDPQGFPLTFSLEEGPETMTVDATRGILSWTPTLMELGTHRVTLRVDDGAGASDSQSYQISVTDPGDITAPQVFVNLDKVEVAPGEAVNVGIAHADKVGVTRLIATVNGEPLTLDTEAHATISYTQAGVYRVHAVAEDAAGNQAEHAQSFWVRAPDETEYPQVILHTPAKDAILSAPTQVIATITDENLAHWTLELVRNGSDCPQILVEGTENQHSVEIASLDTTLLENGLYTLRLTAFDVNNRGLYDEAVVLIEGQMKPGRFTMAYRDMERSLAGLPIQVNRIYDSGKPCPGDFGYGWNLADANVQASITLGRLHGIEEKSYCVSGSGAIRYPPYDTCTGVERSLYCLEEVVAHYATVTMPDGQTHQFDLILEPEALGDHWENCRRDYPPEFVNVRFEPRDGTHTSLEVIGNNRLLFRYLINEETDQAEWMALDSNGDPWSPSRFRLTTREGIQLTLHRDRGIETLTDLEGNSVSYTATAIRHSSGEEVTLTRDNAGRITTITDPDGNTLHYGYDEAGNLASTTDAEGNTDYYEYDAYHRLISIQDPTGNIPAKWYYDEDGRLIAGEDAYGNQTTYDHDIEDRQEIIRDAAGNTTVYSYDDWGQITSVTNPLGETTTYAYDAEHREISKTQAAGTAESSTDSRDYDEDGKLTSETNPLGHTTTYTYDESRRPITIRDSAGRTIELAYDHLNRPTSIVEMGADYSATYQREGNRYLTHSSDPAGRTWDSVENWRGHLIEQTGPDGILTTFASDARGNPTRQERAGHVWQWTYDRNGRLLREEEPDGLTRSYGYDALGREIEANDERGRITRAEYTARGEVSAIHYPDGTRESYSYDEVGRLKSETDRANRTTVHTYDVVGRRTRITYPDGSTEGWRYDALGRVVEHTDRRGHSTQNTYDAAGNITSVTDAHGNTTHTSYTPDRLLQSRTDALGRTTSYSYDERMRLTTTTFPDGTTKRWEYDELDRMTAEIDALGNRWEYRYDSADLLTEVRDPLGNITQTSYDALGNRNERTDANGQTTRWSHDPGGRETSRTLPLGQEHRWESESGLLEREIEAAGGIADYHYDDMGREQQRILPDGSRITTGYDANGNRTEITDERGTTHFTYDLNERLKRIQQPDGQWLAYSYDANGNITSRRTAQYEVTYAYDGLNRPVTVQDPSGTYQLEYDAVGNTISQTWPNGMRVDKTYDAMNRVTSVAYRDAQGDIQAYYEHTYDARGKRIERAESNGITQRYDYDEAGRLISEEIDRHGEVTRRSFAYDAVGNRLSREQDGLETSYEYDDNNQLIRAGPESYGYDANGALKIRTKPSGTTTYSYDGAGRISRIETADQSIGISYDADGNRVAKNVDGRVTRYLVDPNHRFARIIAEDDGQPIYYTALSGIVAEHGATSHYLQEDGTASITAHSNETGTITERIRYTAHGELEPQTGDSTLAIGYRGEYRDVETGHYNLRARHYDPSTGRFLTQDSWDGDERRPITQNRYLYADADPINRVDPMGFFSLSELVIVNELRLQWGTVYEQAYSVYTPEDADLSREDYNTIMNAMTAGFWGTSGRVHPQHVMEGSRVRGLRKLLPGPGRIRNPWGRRGSPAHRAKIQQIQEFLEGIKWKRLTGGKGKERAKEINNGKKLIRFPDLVMEDLQGNKIAIQVGKRNKSGLPVKREREAILDLRKAKGIDRVWFVEY